MKGLTVGDAIAVVALLVFAAGWVTGAVWIMSQSKEPDPDGGAALLVLALIFGPPFVALSYVGLIVRGRQ